MSERPALPERAWGPGARGRGGRVWGGRPPAISEQPFRTGAGRIDIGKGYAKVTVNTGSGVVAYASVIDNAFADLTAIGMKRQALRGATVPG